MDNLTEMFRGKAMGIEPRIEMREAVGEVEQMATSGSQGFDLDEGVRRTRDPRELTGLGLMGGMDVNSLLSWGNGKKAKLPNLLGEGKKKNINPMDMLGGKVKKSNKNVFGMLGMGSKKSNNGFNMLGMGSKKSNNGFNMLGMGSKKSNKDVFGMLGMGGKPNKHVNNFLSFGNIKAKKQVSFLDKKQKNIINVNAILGIQQKALNKQVKRPDKIGMWRIQQQKGLSLFGDYDNDRVMNVLDCQPKNPFKQGAVDTVRSWFGGGPTSGPEAVDPMTGISLELAKEQAEKEKSMEDLERAIQPPIETYDEEETSGEEITEEEPTVETYDVPPESKEIPEVEVPKYSTSFSYTGKEEISDEELFSEKPKGEGWWAKRKAEKEELDKIKREAMKKAAEKAGELKTGAAYEKAYREELEKLYPEVKERKGTKGRGTSDVDWIMSPSGEYYPVRKAKSKAGKALRRADIAAGRIGRDYNEFTKALGSGMAGFSGGMAGGAFNVSPGLVGQQYAGLVGGGTGVGFSRMMGTTGSGTGFFQMTGGGQKPLSQTVTELVGGRGPMPMQDTGPPQQMPSMASSPPMPVQQTVEQYPQATPEEPRYYSPPQATPQGPPSESGLVYSPLSKRYVRYPRGPYKKRLPGY